MKKTFSRLSGRILIVAILTLSAVAALFAAVPAKPVLAANPSTISFQGKVVNANGTNVSDGSYTFVFRLYQSVNINTYNPNTLSCSADTNCWWEETDTVTVTSGTFQVPLGATCAFTSACNSGHSGIDFNSQNALSLTMKFSTDPAGYMAPLIAMQSVPYALNSDKLGGLAASGFIQNVTSPQAANIDVQAATSGSIGAVIAANASGTGDILDLKNGSNVAVATFGSAGAVLIKNSTNSSAAFQLQNALGDQLFNVDTTSVNLITNSSIEASPLANWVYSGTAGSVARDTSQSYIGNASLNVTTNNGAADGAKQTLATTLSTSTTYYISWEDRLNSGTFTDVIAKFSYDGTTGHASNCTSLNTQTVSLLGWTRHTCQFTTGSAGTAPTSANAIFIVQTAAAIRTFYVDAVQLQTVAPSVYNDGEISLNGVVSSPVALQNNSDSSTAFQIQNSSSDPIVTVDTLYDNGTYQGRVGIGELPTTTSQLQVAGSIETTNGNVVIAGSASVLFLSSSNANSGAIQRGAKSTVGAAISANDVVSIAGVNGAAMAVASSNTAHDPNVYGVATSGVSANTYVAVIIFGNTTVNADAGPGAIVIGDQLVTSATTGRVIKDNNATSGIVGYALSALPSGTGTVSIMVRPVGGANTPKFQNNADSATAFQIQNAASTAVLIADTIHSQITVRGINSTATYGSELLSSSTCSGTNWAGSGTGPYTHSTGSTVVLSCTPPASVTAGANYQVVFNVGGSVTAGETVTAQVGGTPSNTPVGIATTNETEIINAGSTTNLRFAPTSNFNGTVTIVSLKQLTQTSNNVLSIANSDGSAGIEIRSGGIGLDNTIVGNRAGRSVSSGSDNVVIGVDALQNTTTGSNNNAIGSGALQSNTTGTNNTANGQAALNANTTGGDNTATGSFALQFATASDNTANGYASLANTTIGNQNSAIGSFSLNVNTTGSNNASLGYGSGGLNTTGSENTYIGSFAGYQDPNVSSFQTPANLQNATAIGFGSQVQQSNSLILGGQDGGAANVGIGTTSPDNLFSISPDIYDTGTACQGNTSACNTTGTSIFGAGSASWTANMVGNDIIFADGTKYTITGFTSPTQLTVATSAIKAASFYRIHNPAFFVSNTGSAAFRNSANSTTAFQVENATAATMFGVNTTNSKVSVGSNTTDTNQVLLQLDSFSTFADTAACTTSSDQGAVYYNTTSNAIRGCVNGAWEDMVSTGSLGLQLFGVVPDSGSGANNGDLAGVTGLTAGPCKVSEGGTTSTVSWTGCTAFSGGRKVIVAAGTTTTSSGTTPNIWQHLCLTAANGQPALSAIGSEVANLATVSMPGTTNPILCLADIKVNTGTAVIGGIYNTATYTTTNKEFATAITNAAGLGMIAITAPSGSASGAVTPAAVLQTTGIVGVIIASTGATSTNTINVIVAINGPAWVKAITETGNAVGNTIQTTATVGYAGAFTTGVFTATAAAYQALGIARTTWTSTCAINSLGCSSSVLTNVNPR